MRKFWRNTYFQYLLAFLAAFFIFLLPKWEEDKIDAPAPRFLAGDTLSCTVLIKNSTAVKGHTMGYVYELFQNFDAFQMCKTNIVPQENLFSEWVKLSTGRTDILIINSLRDTVPEIFQDEVISSVPINRAEDVCVVNKRNYQIIQTFNHWFAFFRQTAEFKLMTGKYYRNYSVSDPFGNPVSRSSISPYDNAIKASSKLVGWDWRLLASLIYQESKFKVGVSSSKGAIGLMQIKESVARKYGINDIYNPEENIKAGTLHLKRLQTMYQKMGADSLNAALLTIAAYNCGEGRMADCMNLAEQEGKNALLWEEIKTIIPLMKDKEYYDSDAVKLGKFRGKETLKYVDHVLDRYQKYQETVSP